MQSQSVEKKSSTGEEPPLIIIMYVMCCFSYSFAASLWLPIHIIISIIIPLMACRRSNLRFYVPFFPSSCGSETRASFRFSQKIWKAKKSRMKTKKNFSLGLGLEEQKMRSAKEWSRGSVFISPNISSRKRISHKAPNGKQFKRFLCVAEKSPGGRKRERETEKSRKIIKMKEF